MFVKLFLQTCIQHKKQIRNLINKHCIHMDNKESILKVSISHVKHCFKQQSLNVTEGYACIIADCPICINVKKDSKIYINKTTGLFICDKCKYTGSWTILEKFLSIQKSGDKLKELDALRASCHLEENLKKKWNDRIKGCQNVADMSKTEYNSLLTTFSLPNILQDNLSKLNCFYDKATEKLHFPLTGLNNSIVGYKVLTPQPGKEQTVPGSGVSGCIKYKNSKSRSENTAVVVGMVDDLLTLISKELTDTIICLPHNLKNLPQELLPCLESFKKLILWFGNDETSWYTARHFSKKLNEKRCYFIRPIDSQPRPKIAGEIGYNFQNILQNAQPVWHKSIITFDELREDILSDLQNIDKVQGVKWKRYPTLNRILKGHRRGEFTILTGPTGSGKTTFMSEYSLDLAMQGVSTLWGSFEIRNVRLAKTMLQQMILTPLDKNVESFNIYADAFEKLPIYFMTFHGQQSIKVVMDVVEHATYVHDIAHVVIDNVQFMMGTSDESKHMDRFWRQDSIISRFRNFATKSNCHVTAIIHPRKERDDEELTTSSIFGSAKASQEADNILIIQDKRLTSVRGKKYLQVAKNRYSGDLGVMTLDFDKSSLSYASKIKTKEKDKSSMKKQSTQESSEETTIKEYFEKSIV